MKFKLGEVVRFNSNISDPELRGQLCIIIELYPYNINYQYVIRTTYSHNPGNHLTGMIKEEWVDHV